METEMTERPTFSVVVAAYNAARTLPATIRSVLGQTRNDFEIIVVDDGSTDSTDRALAGIRDDRIIYIRQENLGPSAARNSGIQRASGELVSFLDSDDLWLPNYLETMHSALRAAPHAGLAYTDAWRLDDVTRRIHRHTLMGPQRPPRSPPADPAALVAALLERNFVFTSATVRRSVLDAVGGFNKALTRSEDYELWLRIAASGVRFANTEKVLVVYRDRPGSLTHDRVAMRRGRAEVYEHILATYATGAIRTIAERRLLETRQELDNLLANAERSREFSVIRRSRGIANRLRRYRLRPPRAVTAAFPDLRAI
jgi:glycosyltransferase involved in cell wall biosynthesis